RLERTGRVAALRRVARNGGPAGARPVRRAHAERQDIVVALHLAVAGERRVDPIGVAAEGRHARAELHDHAELLPAHALEVLDEEPRVAARVADVADGAGDLAPDRFEDRIELGDTTGVEDLLLLPVLGQ